MAETILTIAVILVALAAVSLVVYPVLRICIAIIRDKQRRAKKHSQRQLLHQQFGLITGEDQLWSGRTAWGRDSLEFVVAGDETGPDPGLIDVLSQRLASADCLRKAALEALSSEETVEQEAFTLQSVDLLWEDKPDRLAMEFLMSGDPDGIWRVEFHGDQVVSVGRDD
jgi:hypothetical protein